MRKLLLASISTLLLVVSCKTQNTKTGNEPCEDSIWEAPTPASNNLDKYDSLKHELNKRRQQKQK